VRNVHPQKQIVTDPASMNRRDQVYAEQVRILYRHVPVAFPINAAIGVMVSIMVWGFVPPVSIFAWLACVLAAVALRFALWYFYRRAAPSPPQARRWGRRLIFAMLCSGVAWGSASVVLFAPDAVPQQLGVLVTVVGLAAGVMLSTACYVPVFYAFLIPSLLPFSVVFFIQGTPFFAVIAGLIVIGTVGMMLVARESYRMIRELVTLRLELVVQKEAAERANIAKSKFLAAASHDLRQPLHALALFVSTFDERIHDAVERVTFSNIKRSIAALDGLFNALLDISKLDAGVIQPDFQNLSIKPLLERLEVEYAPQAKAKSLGWRAAGRDVVVYSDPVLLETILRNLISNAIRYTDKGEVAVDCRREDGRICIAVVDTGIGIPQEQQHEIFREFHQLGNPERDRTKGLGLGLAIVDRLAKLLDHGISVDSSPGKGSRFSVELSPGDPAALSFPASPAPEETPGNLAGIVVVVIDDEADIREAMQQVLEGWGCKAVVAASDQEAEGKLSELSRTPDVIIADYRLRDNRTGVQAIERLRAQFGRDIPGVIVSGDIAPERLQEAQASGHTLLHKPVAPAKLRAFIWHAKRGKTRQARV